MDAQSPKKVRGYYLPEDVMKWLDSKAAAERRSASWYLAELLRSVMQADAER